jgi:hypothetical protein
LFSVRPEGTRFFVHTEAGVLFRIKLLVIAMLYGASLMAAISNTFMLATYLSSGRPVGSTLPIALMGWGVILFLHKRMGWPPFHRAGPS